MTARLNGRSYKRSQKSIRIGILVIAHVALLEIRAAAEYQSQVFGPQFQVRAVAEGYATRLLLPQSEVRDLLPDGLDLVVDQDLPEGQHPVTVMVVQQRNFAVEWLPGRWFNVGDYLETLVAVNEVTWSATERGLQNSDKQTDVFWYFHRAGATSRIAVWGGRYFGYSKDRLRVAGDWKDLEVRTTRGREWLRLGWEASPREPSPEAIARVQQELSRWVIAGSPGNWTCSKFDWDFSQVATTTARAAWQLPAGILGEQARSFIAEPLDAGGRGAYAMRAPWKLVGPLPCEGAARRAHHRRQ